MKRGAKPRPIAEKRQRATFRPHRHAELVDVAAPAGVPARPDWLTPEASEAFDDLAEHLVASGLAVPADGVLIASAAQLIQACSTAWRCGEAPPAAHIAELRRHLELLGAAGPRSRVVSGVQPRAADNPFSRNGRRPRDEEDG